MCKKVYMTTILSYLYYILIELFKRYLIANQYETKKNYFDMIKTRFGSILANLLQTPNTT